MITIHHLIQANKDNFSALETFVKAFSQQYLKRIDMTIVPAKHSFLEEDIISTKKLIVATDFPHVHQTFAEASQHDCFEFRTFSHEAIAITALNKSVIEKICLQEKISLNIPLENQSINNQTTSPLKIKHDSDKSKITATPSFLAPINTSPSPEELEIFKKWIMERYEISSEYINKKDQSYFWKTLEVTPPGQVIKSYTLRTNAETPINPVHCEDDIKSSGIFQQINGIEIQYKKLNVSSNACQMIIKVTEPLAFSYSLRQLVTEKPIQVDAPLVPAPTKTETSQAAIQKPEPKPQEISVATTGFFANDKLSEKNYPEYSKNQISFALKKIREQCERTDNVNLHQYMEHVSSMNGKEIEIIKVTPTDDIDKKTFLKQFRLAFPESEKYMTTYTRWDGNKAGAFYIQIIDFQLFCTKLNVKYQEPASKPGHYL
jgi:hypothetical protein